MRGVSGRRSLGGLAAICLVGVGATRCGAAYVDVRHHAAKAPGLAPAHARSARRT